MAKFHERFGIELGVEEGKRRFVNRFHNFLQTVLSKARCNGIRTETERYICTKIGERWTVSGCVEIFIGNNFNKCLIALEALYVHSKWDGFTEREIKNLLADTEIDIGIRWENGHFLPAGAPALDEALVHDPLNLLSTLEYKGVSHAFKKGLDHFLHSTQKPSFLADVLTAMYEAIEALAKIVCRNEKDLSANREGSSQILG
jgi:hypothetical protein